MERSFKFQVRSHSALSLSFMTDCYWLVVPGLQDNSELCIRKNKMTLAGTEVKEIFDPVVKEVLNLVTGQIKAAKRHVKAVLLVGGFGQNAYLRDAIREEVKSSNVEVLQSPNRYILTFQQKRRWANIPTVGLRLCEVP